MKQQHDMLPQVQHRPHKVQSKVHRKVQRAPDSTRRPKLQRTSESVLNPIPGARKLLCREVTFSEKLLWVCVLVVISVACFYQAMERILNYVQTPVNIDVNIIHKHSFVFPAITICPEPGRRKSRIWDRIREAAIANHILPFDIGNVTFSELKLNLDDLLKTDAIGEADVTMTTPCLNKIHGDSCETPVSVQKDALWTIFGRCLTVTMEKAMPFRGPSTIIIARVNRSLAQIIYHRPHFNIRHDSYFMAQRMTENVKTVVSLSAKEFKFKNIRSNPCVTLEEASSCRDECINKTFLKNSAFHCSTSILQILELPVCKTVNDGIRFVTAVEQSYMNLTAKDCQCTRKCYDVVYSYVYDTSLYNGSHSGIELFMVYPINVQELVTEEYSYSFAALISDIGGTLGFYIGFCILQFLEIMVTGCKKCHCFKNH